MNGARWAIAFPKGMAVIVFELTSKLIIVKNDSVLSTIVIINTKAYSSVAASTRNPPADLKTLRKLAIELG